MEVAAARADERKEGHPRRGGHVDREAGSGADRHHRRNGSFQGFLYEFETGPSADDQNTVVERDGSIEHRPSDDFIYGVVATDVFAYRQELAVQCEEPGGVNTARRFEEWLVGPHPFRKTCQQLC